MTTIEIAVLLFVLAVIFHRTIDRMAGQPDNLWDSLHRKDRRNGWD